MDYHAEQSDTFYRAEHVYKQMFSFGVFVGRSGLIDARPPATHRLYSRKIIKLQANTFSQDLLISRRGFDGVSEYVGLRAHQKAGTKETELYSDLTSVISGCPCGQN